METKDLIKDLLGLVNEKIDAGLFFVESEAGCQIGCKAGNQPRIALPGRTLSPDEMKFYLVGLWYGLNEK